MLKNTNILVIGATGGIGREVSRLLAQSNANLFLTGRNEQKLRDIASELHITPDRTMVLDLAKAEQIDAMKENYFNVMSSVDILINCSGIGVIKSIDQLTHEDFLNTLQINLIAPFMILKQFLPSMKEAKKGLIIHIPGVLGKVPMSGAAAYSASKYGLVGMIQGIREEIKRTDIRFTNLFLGGTNSPFWDEIDMRVQREKMVTSLDAAKAVWFLCQQPASGVVNEMVLQPFNHQVI